MRGQDFEAVRSELLPVLERLTVEEHHAVLGGPDWAPPQAYRWIRYEDPDPIGQLLAAGERLDVLWRGRPLEARKAFAAREREALEDAHGVARRLGYRG